MNHIKSFELFFEAKKEEESVLTPGQKKLPKALQDAIIKKAGKTPKKEEEKESKGKSKKEDSKEKGKGLTAGQKKLPKALQDAILKKQK